MSRLVTHCSSVAISVCVQLIKTVVFRTVSTKTHHAVTLEVRPRYGILKDEWNTPGDCLGAPKPTVG